MKIVAILLCMFSVSCLETKDINTEPMRLKCIRFNYDFPGRGTFPADYCFDTEHALCYASISHGDFQVVDFKNCYDLFQEYIDQPERAEKP